MKAHDLLYRAAHGLIVLLAFELTTGAGGAATLSGGFTSISRGAVVNLTADGPLDWVHWGLYTDTSLDRKANVVEQITDFKLVASSNFFGFAYQFSDNWGGYSWSDGTPDARVTGTTTGVYAVGLGHGFQFSIPAGTAVKTLKVYVGAYGASGKFQASLSDNSAAAYVDSSLSNSANGPNGLYEITFAGRSAGSKLNIKWTVDGMIDETYGNVTLQSATLTSATANNPPFVELTSPTDNGAFTAGGNVTLAANAIDFDGTITKVEFFQGTTKLGEDLASPFSFTWTGVTAGRYWLWARATDNKGATSSSDLLEIFVNTGGGTMIGSTSKPPTLPLSVNLTTEGTADWVHWGARTNGILDRKAGVEMQISDYTPIGNGTVERYADNYTSFSWSDGTPTASVAGTKTGVFIPGVTNGFELTLPADTTSRTVKLYLGLYAAKGLFQAWLSDFSAKVYADTSLSNTLGNSYAAYTLNYSAASAGQALTVRFTAREIYDPDYGNVTLQSVTLAGGPPANAPPVVYLSSPSNGASFVAPANITLTASANDTDGSIAKVEFFEGANKLGEDTTNPYSFDWNNVGVGTYTLTVKATDDRGATAISSPISIVVSNSVSAPVVLQNPTWSGGDFWFSFGSQTGHNYEVQYTDALGPGPWQVLTTLNGNGSTLSVTQRNVSASQRMYRVQTK